jgi:hypothetical protein
VFLHIFRTILGVCSAQYGRCSVVNVLLERLSGRDVDEQMGQSDKHMLFWNQALQSQKVLLDEVMSRLEKVEQTLARFSAATDLAHQQQRRFWGVFGLGG